MRATLGLLVTLAFACSSASAGQGTTPPASPPASAPSAPASIAPRIGQVDFGVRLTGISGDPARFQRLRDLRSGPTLDRLRYDRDTDAWNAQAAIDHAGYRDQRYLVGFERYGRLKTTFEWSQVPLFLSTDTRTPYRRELEGVLRLNDVLQAAVQNRTATKDVYLGEMQRFDLRSRRDVADARFGFAVNRNLDLRVSMTSTARKGEQAFGGGFAQGHSVELPAPLHHRTNDLSAAAEWSNERGMARLAYDGSWFRNSVETLIWDNPLRISDQISSTGEGPSQGRMALWPDSTAHTVSGAGSIALPARTRAFGYLSIANWLQDQELLPFTINSAIPPIPLARSTAEAEARIVSMNYRVTSRPSRTIWLNAQYRLYDFDNRTPRFQETQYVQLDGTAVPSVTGGNEPFGYTRHFVDLDASYSPRRFVALRAGYGLEHDNRTFRFLDETIEHTARAAVDSTGLAWGSVRVQYEHSVRTGDGLDEQALSDIGEQVSLRQFDISNRVRDRVGAMVQAVPLSTVGLNASIGIGQDHRPDAAFGLQDNDFRSVTVGADFTPTAAVLIGASYGFENYSTLQRSRQANPGPQFNDPTRDWSTDMNEDVHTVGASLDLPHLTRRSTLHAAYDYVRSNARYLYVLPPNTTLPTPVQLSPVLNRIRRASADLRYTLTSQVALGVGYAYDAYDVDDFALSPATLNSPIFPALIDLMYQWRPYTAHSGSVRLIYNW